MQPPLPAPVATWRNDTYDAISPLRPELSQKGKTVVITGAGSGIGRETVLAFASAGAAHVALLGRSESALTETASTASSSYPQTKTSIHAVDIADEAAAAKVAADIGTWDVLIHGAGHVSEPSTIASANVADFWKSFETNAKGTFVVLHSFANTANPEHATVLALTTGTTALPPAMVPGLSAYMASKLAQVKLVEHFAAENSHIMAANVHPGMVETKVFTRSGAKAEQLPMDTVQLPAHFLVWMSSPEATFLKGRSAWSNWDVTELQEKAASITNGLDLTSGVNGWPFGV